MDDEICPWCMEDGSAHEKFEAMFTDSAGIGGGLWDAVSVEVKKEVALRTPGFSGWQQERWFTCCGDAAAFLGPAGKKEIEENGGEAIEAIRSDTGLSGAEWDEFFAVLSRDVQPTAYLFQCLRCGQFGGDTDCT